MRNIIFGWILIVIYKIWINTKVLLASNSEFLELESEETEQGIYQPPSQ
ncbi:MAG: hypothetical protein Ct9H90mP2_11530 [Dehalococcoidia bacterium]|nr:MAG: hypothetical protein Ct9H90mP2_11530 [Dehalococcoidia bacterium]